MIRIHNYLDNISIACTVLVNYRSIITKLSEQRLEHSATSLFICSTVEFKYYHLFSLQRIFVTHLISREGVKQKKGPYFTVMLKVGFAFSPRYKRGKKVSAFGYYGAASMSLLSISPTLPHKTPGSRCCVGIHKVRQQRTYPPPTPYFFFVCVDCVVREGGGGLRMRKDAVSVAHAGKLDRPAERRGEGGSLTACWLVIQKSHLICKISMVVVIMISSMG